MSGTKQRFKLMGVVYLLLRDGDKILIMRRANTGYMDGRYSLPAGHFDGDETATTAMAREAKEETGITIDLADLKMVHVSHCLNRGEHEQERINFFFEATKWSGEVFNAEPDKCEELAWYPMDALPENLVPYVRITLDQIKDGKLYSEFDFDPTD